MGKPRRRRRRRIRTRTRTTPTSLKEVIFVHSFIRSIVHPREREIERERLGANELPTSITDTNTFFINETKNKNNNNINNTSLREVIFVHSFNRTIVQSFEREREGKKERRREGEKERDR